MTGPDLRFRESASGFDILKSRHGMRVAVSSEPARATLSDYRQWVSDTQQGSVACAIINADDWGESVYTTDRILDCLQAGSVTAVSAMVFMADSERAAEIARERKVDVGLHLNLTASLSAVKLPRQLSEHQEAVVSYLRRSKLSRYVYHSGLATSFDYAVASQFEEFRRLYGARPERIDGHHHMHLCANVLLGGLLPAGVVIRRNFCFERGEKGWANRGARRAFDRLLARRYRMLDAFVSLAPLQPSARIAGIFSRACRESVEIETHPANATEYDFLLGRQLTRFARRYGDWSG